MDVLEKIDVLENVVHCCFSKGRCLDCNFYIMEDTGAGRCQGMKKIGPILEQYTKDIKKELRYAKENRHC